MAAILKRNKIVSFAEKWMDLESFIQSKVSQKVKGVVEDLKILKKRNYSKNSKNISRIFSGFVVGSVHFWLVPWSDLYFSRSIGPFLCSP